MEYEDQSQQEMTANPMAAAAVGTEEPPFELFQPIVLANASMVATTSTTTPPSTSVLPSLSSFKLWNENLKICELFTQALQDLTRDLDPIAITLIIVALIIAVVGAVAIVCQCQMWRKSKRQRHYDTSSLWDYAFDREKLSGGGGGGGGQQLNAKLQRQLDNKKFISKLFQSSLLPPMPPSSLHHAHQQPHGHAHHGYSHTQHHHNNNGINQATMNGKFCPLNDSQLYLNALHHHHHTSSPARHFTPVDIDQCQLVQSFMKHSETGKQYLESKKQQKKQQQQKELHKELKKAQKKGAGKKQAASKKATATESGKQKKESGKKNRLSKHSKRMLASGGDRCDTLPFFTSASLSSSSKLSDCLEQQQQNSHSHHSANLNRSGSSTLAALKKEYETQVAEINLTGSEDGESQTNVSIDEKIYERIMQYPRSATTTVTASSSGSKALLQPPPPAAKPHQSASANHQIHQQQSNSTPPKAVQSSSSLSGNNRQRQLFPPSNIVEKATSRSQPHLLGPKSKYHQQQQPHRYSATSSGSGSGGTLAKNPLYTEIGEHEESIIFSDDSASTMFCSAVPTTANTNTATANGKSAVGGGYALDSTMTTVNESRTSQIYSQIQPPANNNRQMTYSTFIKPPSPHAYR